MFVTRAAYDLAVQRAERAEALYDALLEKYHSLRQANYAPRVVEANAVVPPMPEPEDRMKERERAMAVEQMAAALKADGIPEAQAKAEAERLIGDVYAPVTLDDAMAFI